MIARYAIPFFFIMGLVAAPIVFVLLSRWLAPRRLWRRIALACTIIIWALVCYGSFVGFEQMEVVRMKYTSADLPKAFNGYRIVQFSDAHVGTYTGSRQWLLQRAVDSINALKADMVVFTGDLENLHPDELKDQLGILRQVRAKDGVFTIMGNHDYPTYLDIDERSKQRLVALTEQYERQIGWQLLLNEHRVIRRGSDSIVVAGMENWGSLKRMPRLGDVKKTMAGVSDSSFVLMLQHDPSAWRAKILPECHAQLTLSGHTHGGQFSIFGWSPAAFTYDVWHGWDREDERALYVSSGLGGLIPFRLNMPGEIVEITLESKN